MNFRTVTLQPKSSVRSPAKGATVAATTVPTKESTPTSDEKKGSSTAPYIRRVSKKEKNKWNADNDEETALCHSNTLHEVSIISSNKDESTVV
jgi:hypothetical protein